MTPAAAARPVVVLATSNPGKRHEVRALLGELAIELVDLSAFPGVALPSEGDDYERNALGKALAAARATGRLALGDDSGLEVEALGGGPGPRSARYGGPGLDDAGRVAKLLEALAGVPVEKRAARFVCAAALATPEGESVVRRGACAGRILESARGAGGFGYDPVFQPDGWPVSMAELPAAEKNRISHRARAFQGLLPEITARLSDEAE